MMLDLVSADKETRKTQHSSIVRFWHKCELPECPLLRRSWDDGGRDADTV